LRVLGALALAASAGPAFGQGVLNVTIASIPSTATRVAAIADGAPVSSPVYALKNVTQPVTSTLVSMSLPAGTYRIRVLADGPSRALLASAQAASIVVPNGNTAAAFIALASVSVTVDASTPSSAGAGSPVTIKFDITDWGDVMQGATSNLYTATSAFSVAAGGVLASSGTPVEGAAGHYTASFTIAPSIGSTSLYYALRVAVPVGNPDCPYLYSPNPNSSPNQPWLMTVTAQAGINVSVTGIPATASRLVVIADIAPSAPLYAQRAVTPGTASAAAFIAVPAGNYRVRILADSPTTGMLASGQGTATVTTGVTASASVALTAMTVTVDSSTPASAAAASSVPILFDVVDAGNVLSGIYAYLWAGLAPFGVAQGGTLASVASFVSAGSGTVQAGFSVQLPAGVATYYYALRAQVPTGVDYSVLSSPNPAQSPDAPWQIQTSITTELSLTVQNIPANGVRLVVLADGPLPSVAWTEQTLSGTSSATIVVAAPAGTYRLRALVDGAAGDILASGQTGAVVPSSGVGTASVTLSPPIATLSSATPLSAQAGSTIILGFNVADSGDVIENANASLYTGSAAFDLATGGFLLGVYPVTKVSTGQYTVSFSDTAPSTASTLYFQVRVQVTTGLTPSYLDSPDPAANSGPWSMAITLPSTQPCTPVAVFRDTNGSIRLIAYGSNTVYFLGGQLASDPAVVQSSSCVIYIAARDNYNIIWMSVVDLAANTATWHSLGGSSFQGKPSVAIARNGRVYIGARDTNGAFWLIGYASGIFSPWTYIGGVLRTDPVLATSPDGSLYMVGIDQYNLVWNALYITGTGFIGWQLLPSGVQGNPTVTVGSDAYAYIAFRDAYDFLWVGRLQGTSFSGFGWAGGQLYSDPQIAADSAGMLWVAMLDEWNNVFYRGFHEGAYGAWLNWTLAPYRWQTLSAAATPGQLYIVGRDSANALWWYRMTTGVLSAAGGNGLTTGALAAAPR
jgi:hypothetical protein